MTIDELTNQFGHLFNVVVEPENSKQKLIEYQMKYPSYSSDYVNWLYSIQGFKDELLYLVPEVEDWCYYYKRFLKYGGNELDLRCLDEFEDAHNLIINNNSKKEEGLMPSFIFYLQVLSPDV